MDEDLKELQNEAAPEKLAENGETTAEAGFGQEYDEPKIDQNEQKWTGAGDETQVYSGEERASFSAPSFSRDLF